MTDLLLVIAALALFGAAHLYVEGLCSPERERPVMIANALLLLLSVALMVYLVFALLRPEKF